LVERARVLGERLRAEMDGLAAHPLVGDIRSFGFLLGIELVADKETKQPASAETVKGIIGQCKSRGLIVGRNGDTVAGFNNVLTFCPPLSSTDEDLAFICAAFKAVMNDQSEEARQHQPG
jgi:taurine-pyruvate aminotransferase